MIFYSPALYAAYKMRLDEFFVKSDKITKIKAKIRSEVNTNIKMSDFDFNQIHLSNVKISQINIEGIILQIKYISKILYFIYDFLDNIELIKKNTLLNIQNGYIKGTGFVYLKKLDISVQGATAQRLFQEIFNQIIKNDITAIINFRVHGNSFIVSHILS
jgi:hypothetical protein